MHIHAQNTCTHMHIHAQNTCTHTHKTHVHKTHVHTCTKHMYTHAHTCTKHMHIHAQNTCTNTCTHMHKTHVHMCTKHLCRYATSVGAKHYYTSAKQNKGIQELFLDISKREWCVFIIQWQSESYMDQKGCV